MPCRLTRSLINDACEYAVAGVAKLYLANWYAPGVGTESGANVINYQIDPDGIVTGIFLPTSESFYEIDGANNTLSFGDNLLEGGNGGKYRQHLVNGVIDQLDESILSQGDAISLGRFIAVAVDTAGRITLLGRTGGLTATANGFDYASGAAEADALGWTLALQGSSTEIARKVESMSVVTPIYVEQVEP